MQNITKYFWRLDWPKIFGRKYPECNNHRDEEFLEHMEFQPIKGKPTFDIDNLDNTFTQSKVETVETSEGSWMFDLRDVCILEFRTSDILPSDV